MRGWYPIEFLHFPIRSFEQCERKYRNLRDSLGESRNAYYEEVHRAREEGRFAEWYEAHVIDDEALERGLEEGSLVIDTRLRDALRARRNGGALTLPRPTVVDDAAYAVDVAALGEADVVRLQRRLDELEPRLRALEGRPAARVTRRLGSAARRLKRGGS
jgi:hypothetical protein